MPSPAEDRDEILQLLYRYSHAIDSHRVEEWASLFVTDGVFEGRGKTFVGTAELQKAAASIPAGTLRHVLVNPLIDVDADTATVRSYVLVLRGGTVATTGSYSDELVRSPDGWRFRKRTYSPDDHTVAPEAS